MTAWRKSCTRHEHSVTVLEFQLDCVPPISVHEVEAVLGRFVELAVREKASGNALLDEDLLED